METSKAYTTIKAKYSNNGDNQQSEMIQVNVQEAAQTQTQEITEPESLKLPAFSNSPRFPSKIFGNLPPMLRHLSLYFDGEGRQRDIFLFSIIHLISACLPNVKGMYFGKRLSANLYGLVGGPPGTGKSAMDTVMTLADPIRKRFAAINQERIQEFSNEMQSIPKKGPRPLPPEPTYFRVPGNISSAGIIKLLTNSQHAIIAETEADTISNVLNQRSMDWSELLRKAYHHEPVMCFRKTDIMRELLHRNLTLLLTGTPMQIKRLIKTPENGLLSRFSFYVYDEKPSFINPFKNEFNELVELLEHYGANVEVMFFDLLGRSNPVEFTFSDEQKIKFESMFAPIVDSYYDLSGSDAASIAMRLDVIFFRIAMVLSLLRDFHSDKVVCSDADFETAEEIIRVLSQHAVIVLTSFPDEPTSIIGLNSRARRIIEELPAGRFHTSLVRKIFAEEHYSRRTVFRVLTEMEAQGAIKKVGHGIYERIR